MFSPAWFFHSDEGQHSIVFGAAAGSCECDLDQLRGWGQTFDEEREIGLSQE